VGVAASVWATVQITDVNDNVPYFNQTTFNINVDENYYVAQGIVPLIFVYDPDSCKSHHNLCW
jgi:hypothetical protein